MKKSFLVLLGFILILTGCQMSSSSISQQEAVDIALTHASVNEKDTESLKVVKGDNNNSAYFITFSDAMNTYEYSIGFNGDINHYERSKHSELNREEVNNDYKEEDALQTALDHAKVSKEDAMILKIEREYDDLEYVFEIKFRTETTNYEYEISDSGKILDYEVEQYYQDDHIVYTRPTYFYSGASRYYYRSNPSRTIDLADVISQEEAVRIALEHAGVSQENASITKIERDTYEYDIKFVSGEYRYEYEIALDGVVIKSKEKRR